ncbi:hypothetical protein [Dolosigranulum savutiense]|uniref:Uncharacterized protein n=1 Tax=Dolosigranulum savutiense TaxID=3110288 RepID=A0AB74TMR5_9LACT
MTGLVTEPNGTGNGTDDGTDDGTGNIVPGTDGDSDNGMMMILITERRWMTGTGN